MSEPATLPLIGIPRNRSDPHDGHTIRGTKIAHKQRFPEFGIGLALYQKIEIRSSNEKRHLASHCRMNTSDDILHTNQIDRDAKDAIDLA